MGIKKHERKRDIERRRHRKKKLANLRRRIKDAKGEERERLIQKFKKISPQAPLEIAD